jgi:HAD superfamily hydrolase (TIGR01509 family)
MKNIKALLFDMDGILLDSEFYYMNGTFKYMKNLGFTGTMEDLSVLVGVTMDTMCKMCSNMLDNRYSPSDILKINNDYFDENPINHQDAMFENIDVILKKLKEEGYLLALCSSSSMSIIQRDLTAMKIIDLFNVILTGEDFEKPKPDPDIYLHAMERLNIKPDQCIIYEDSNLGIRAGLASGAVTIARIDNRFNQNQSMANYQVKDINEYYKKIKEI